eukprot:jgi/Phyca11/13891/fgenesh1_pg.PHYCAscaffold_5_\
MTALALLSVLAVMIITSTTSDPDLIKENLAQQPSLADAPSLRLHFTLKRSSMEIFGHSEFDIFANPVISPDNTTVLYDGYAKFEDETTSRTLLLVDGVVYYVKSAVDNASVPETTRCIAASSLPPLNSIIAALNDAIPISSATSEDEVAVALLIGRCPANTAVKSLTYETDPRTSPALRTAYKAAQAAFQKNVGAVMCSSNYGGLLSRWQPVYIMAGMMIPHKSKENDGMVEFHSCAGGFPTSKFGENYIDTFYSTGLNHVDTSFRNGDGLLSTARKPVKCGSATDSCAFECFTNGPSDFAANGAVDFTDYVFFIPYGNEESKWEANWTSSQASTVDSQLASEEDQTKTYPSESNLVFKDMEPLTFLTKTTTVITLLNLGFDVDPPQSTFPTTNVESFRMSNCLLSTYPADLEFMTSVVHVDFSQNYFKDYPVKFSHETMETGNFPNMTTLDLSGNTLTDIPSNIFDMPKLKTLNLSDNSFTGVSLTAKQFSLFVAIDDGNAAEKASEPLQDSLIRRIRLRVMAFRFGMIKNSYHCK